MIRKFTVVVILALIVSPIMGLDAHENVGKEIEYLPIFCQAEKDQSELLAVYY